MVKSLINTEPLDTTSGYNLRLQPADSHTAAAAALATAPQGAVTWCGKIHTGDLRSLTS